MENRSEFVDLVKNVHDLLDEIEMQLGHNHFGEDDHPDEWLCCDSFTVADLSLAVLLHRLSSLGLESLFWQSELPLTRKYYERICVRDSFVRSLRPRPSFHSRLEVMIMQLSPIQLVTAVTMVSAAIVVPFLAMGGK